MLCCKQLFVWWQLKIFGYSLLFQWTQKRWQKWGSSVQLPVFISIVFWGMFVTGVRRKCLAYDGDDQRWTLFSVLKLLCFDCLFVQMERWFNWHHVSHSKLSSLKHHKISCLNSPYSTHDKLKQLTHCSYLHVCLWNFEYVETRVSPFLLYNMLFWLHIQNIAASSNMGDIQQWWHPQWSPDLSSQNWVMSLNLVLNVQTADEVLYKPFS